MLISKLFCKQLSIKVMFQVRLSSDDLASQELASWREREAKHQIDMIKKSELELLNCNRQFVFKTHKGITNNQNSRNTHNQMADDLISEALV